MTKKKTGPYEEPGGEPSMIIRPQKPWQENPRKDYIGDLLISQGIETELTESSYLKNVVGPIGIIKTLMNSAINTATNIIVEKCGGSSLGSFPEEGNDEVAIVQSSGGDLPEQLVYVVSIQQQSQGRYRIRAQTNIAELL